MESQTSFPNVRRRLGEVLWRRLVTRYVSWKSPDEAALYPERAIAQVMNIGTHEDCETLRDRLGDDVLAEVLHIAWPGWFDARSSTYWQLRVGAAQPGSVPPPPRRVLS